MEVRAFTQQTTIDSDTVARTECRVSLRDGVWKRGQRPCTRGLDGQVCACRPFSGQAASHHEHELYRMQPCEVSVSDLARRAWISCRLAHSSGKRDVSEKCEVVSGITELPWVTTRSAKVSCDEQIDGSVCFTHEVHAAEARSIQIFRHRLHCRRTTSCDFCLLF